MDAKYSGYTSWGKMQKKRPSESFNKTYRRRKLLVSRILKGTHQLQSGI